MPKAVPIISDALISPFFSRIHPNQFPKKMPGHRRASERMRTHGAQAAVTSRSLAVASVGRPSLGAASREASDELAPALSGGPAHRLLLLLRLSAASLEGVVLSQVPPSRAPCLCQAMSL